MKQETQRRNERENRMSEERKNVSHRDRKRTGRTEPSENEGKKSTI